MKKMEYAPNEDYNQNKYRYNINSINNIAPNYQKNSINKLKSGGKMLTKEIKSAKKGDRDKDKIVKAEISKREVNDKIICFLFSSEAKIEDIKIDTKNEIYPFGKSVKDEKTLNIYYIEAIFSNSNIKIDIGKNSFFLKLDNIKFHKSKIFLFNKDLIDENNRKIGKLNCFDINEEFDLYYDGKYNNERFI